MTGLVGALRCACRMTVDVVLQPANERVAAAELLGVEMGEIRRKALAQPDVVPVFFGDGVSPPLVCDFVHDGAATTGDAPFSP